MKMLKIALAAFAGAAAFGAPAVAADISSLGAPGFSYGTLTSTGFSDYTFQPASSSRCLGLGDCYVGDDTFAIIAQGQTASQLLVHPAPGVPNGVLGNSAVGFSAASAGEYLVNTRAISVDSGGKTVGYFTIRNGALSTVDVGSIAGGASQRVATRLTLAAGDRFGVYVNNGDGTYFNDSTNFSGTLGAVPEPATWAMMIGGVGLVGGAMRRRRVTTAKLATA